MKAILILFLLSLTFSYDREKAARYAKNYCNNYNPKYNKYEKNYEESPNFVSQCMKAGGQDFEGCEGKDDKGMVKNATALKECLISKGWTIANFPAIGNPAFIKHSPLVVIISDDNPDRQKVTHCSHEPDRCGATIFSKGLEIYSKNK